jgi:enolase
MMNQIRRISALEILDARGIPTIQVDIQLDSGASGSASVPSGTSTGENEAVELRDGDPLRYGGKGILQALEVVDKEIAPALVGRRAASVAEIDKQLLELDGTSDKSRLGANTILAVSMAVARAAAESARVPLYSYMAHGSCRLPMPMFNILNGGKHADHGLDFQEFMIMPLGAPTFREAVRHAAETFNALRAILHQEGYTTDYGDEGGFACDLASNEAACDFIIQAIEKAGYRPGIDIAIALDAAASSFFDGSYHLKHAAAGALSSAQMVELYRTWAARYPIVSIEDGLAESDWAGFQQLTSALGDDVQIVGDDLYVTNTEFIQRGIDEKASNAALIKLNQIGTVSETIAAVELCQRANWRYVISHRSGETDDTFIADFAMAMGGGQLKAGSLCRGERIAKYNRLLKIEQELGASAVFGNPFAARKTPGKQRASG